MAKLVLKSCFVSINSNDLSASTSKIELTDQFEEKDSTTFGSGGAKEVLGGLESGTLALTFKQDFAASAIDSIMWPLRGTVVTFEVRPTSAAASTSNPKYTGSVLIKEWKPVSGSPGDLAEVSVSFPTSGTTTRATS